MSTMRCTSSVPGIRLQMAEEGEKLLMQMTRLAFVEHRAGGDIEDNKQGGGAMADVMMGDALDITQAHRQHRLGCGSGPESRESLNNCSDRTTEGPRCGISVGLT